MKNKTSYCTFSPDGLFGYYWGHQQHDIEYKKTKKTITRKQADRPAYIYEFGVKAWD